MMTIGIETSGQVGSVAVCEDGKVLAEKYFEKGMRHGRELLPSLKTMFQELGWSTEKVDLIAVSQGPGSYTGLRVGITCAKTLAYALKRPLVPVPTMDVLAENVPPGDVAICPILDARRNQVYACIYKPGGRAPGYKVGASSLALGLWHKVSDYLVITPKELVGILPSPVLVFGDGAFLYRDIFLQEGIIFGSEEMGIPAARVVARLGAEAFRRGTSCDPVQLQPLYLRKSEAEEKWKAPKRT
ncbi:MAG TPA: tRNA (adenosine(37)-N6)-threonylcarbamoyltransferase complex dimerization subunit type 1 TsaB [Candidatus Hypogeohydataceae bacterium YC38]|nr:tRNA (adenosine(37)-N6)-threonylcarbamoyltransferase complex dimerization subunit type 1 TsaB [Candidatus Brocadiales bacterium]